MTGSAHRRRLRHAPEVPTPAPVLRPRTEDWTRAEMVAALPTLHGGAENSTPITAERFKGTVLTPGMVHGAAPGPVRPFPSGPARLA
ncbi:hypothetical protein U5640_02985 [Streptomyces sp. SS7]|uniref:hypothetical protein n=1 Tax=Streptomyces sp. SS7 TaxID=3108485 RepID=UPI0030EB7C93